MIRPGSEEHVVWLHQLKSHNIRAGTEKSEIGPQIKHKKWEPLFKILWELQCCVCKKGNYQNNAPIKKQVIILVPVESQHQ